MYDKNAKHAQEHREMGKRVEMNYQATKKANSPRVRIEKRAIQRRKASNFEVIRDAFEKHGNVKLRLSISILSKDSVLLGFNQTSITIVAPSVETAQEFPEKFRDAIAKLAKELGMVAIRKDVPL
jgi:hypothetical protein